MPISQSSQRRAACPPFSWILLTGWVLLAIVLSSCSGKVNPAPATVTPTRRSGPVSTSSAPPQAPTLLPYQPAVEIGEKIIYQPEVESAVRQVEEALKNLPAGVSTDSISADQRLGMAVEDLIDQELLAQAAFKEGFTLDEKSLRDRYDSLVSTVGQDQLNHYLSAYGISQDFILLSLHRSMAAVWMRDRILKGVPEEAEQVRVRQIITDSPEAAQQIIDQVRQAGADFTTLAFQDDPYTGGDLGWFARGTLFYSTVEEAAFALQPSADGTPVLSDPIQSPLGHHVLLLLGHETRPLSLSARLDLQHKALEDWLAAQRGAVKINIHTITADAPDLPIVQAADAAPRYPVQEGDNYYAIAGRFRVPVQSLIDSNPGSPPETLSTGAEIAIPGIFGWDGRISTIDLPAGADLLSASRALGLDPLLVARLNHLTSPAQLYFGAKLAVPEDLASQALQAVQPLADGQSLLEKAVLTGQSPWSLALSGRVTLPTSILPGQTIFLPPGSPSQTNGPDLSSLVLVQGQTVVFALSPKTTDAVPTGSLDNMTLNFFETSSGWIALQGIPALAEPGLADLQLQWDRNGHRVEFEQSLPLYSGDFLMDPPLTVDPATIDPAVTQPEESQVRAITAPATPERLWNGLFIPPIDTPACTRSLFGNRRSFNGSAYIYFHSGLDYGVCASRDIYAPAAGKIVFAGPLDVRGNATIIDHGWGVYSGFWHQSQIMVQVGDSVQPGQVIGQIGATGRITGEHLHWEVWVGGIQVDPLQWINTDFSAAR